MSEVLAALREHPKARSLNAPQGAFPLQNWQLGLASKAEHSPWAPPGPPVPFGQWRPGQHFPVLSNTKQCCQKLQSKQGTVTVVGCEHSQRQGSSAPGFASPGEEVGVYPAAEVDNVPAEPCTHQGVSAKQSCISSC